MTNTNRSSTGQLSSARGTGAPYQSHHQQQPSMSSNQTQQYNTMSFANLPQNEDDFKFAEDPLLEQAMSSKKVVMMYDVQI